MASTLTKQEQAAIRSRLQLRQTHAGWEVYTVVHGTLHFRWFLISPEIADWYVKNFPEIHIITLEKANDRVREA